MQGGVVSLHFFTGAPCTATSASGFSLAGNTTGNSIKVIRVVDTKLKRSTRRRDLASKHQLSLIHATCTSRAQRSHSYELILSPGEYRDTSQRQANTMP